MRAVPLILIFLTVTAPVWIGSLLDLARLVSNAAIAVFILAVVLAAPILILLHFARRGK